MFFLLIPAQAAHAAGDAANCHCFKNRNFNKTDTFASDDYLLTTTFNALLANEFNISKGRIVMMKMQGGVSNTDMIISLFLARETGVEVNALLDMKKTQNWAATANRAKTKAVTPDIEEKLKFITPQSSDEEIAGRITDNLIIARFPSGRESLQQLKSTRLTAREIVLANTLADHSGTSVQAISKQYLDKGFSWSEIAHNLGLEPAGVGKLLLTEKETGK